MGQTVAADSETPLFDIASVLTVMRVDTKVGEKDIGEVKLGDKATFTVGSFPNRRFAGEVTQIGLRPQMIQNVVTYDVVINASNLDLLLEPGMAAATSIVVGRRDDVLRVPDQALRFSPHGRAPLTGVGSPSTQPGGSSRLWILRDGKARAVAVQLGLDDGAYTEIVKGELQPGEELIVGESDERQMGRKPSLRPSL
jgi:HlyD family secretion protein